MATTSAETPIPPALRPRHPFYTWAAALAVLVAVIGFARTYYLKVAFGTPELSALKHLHGLVMTSWLVLFVVQVRLVATGRTAIHRKVGIAGALIAFMVVFAATDLAITSAREGFTPLATLSPLVFLVLPMGEVVTFTVLITAAILLRKRPEYHKRLMVVGTLSMLTPAVARMVINMGIPPAPPLFFLLTDVMILGCIAYDTMRHKRVHPAFASAFGVVLLIQVGRLVLSQTEAWMTFAKWLVA